MLSKRVQDRPLVQDGAPLPLTGLDTALSKGRNVLGRPDGSVG